MSGAAVASASSIIGGTSSGYHVLKIQGYSTTKATTPNGKCVESRAFRLAGHTWSIQYYPNGCNPEASEYVSLCLLLKDLVFFDPVVVRVRFSFIDQLNLQEPSSVRAAAPCKFLTSNNCSWGYFKFVKRETLEQSPDRLKDDCFTVRCDIIVLGDTRVADAAVPACPAVVAPLPPPDWPQHFRALLRTGQGADVMFRVESKTFTAHRCVLAARSPVFSAELYGATKEGTSTGTAVVQVDDMRADVFGNLLHFIYTDSLQPQETTTTNKTEEAAAEATCMAQHLLEAADRYGMERLKLICEANMCRHIGIGTVGTTLVLAEQRHCKRLRDACFEFIRRLKKRDLDAVVETDGFKHLAKCCPFVLFEVIAKLRD